MQYLLLIYHPETEWAQTELASKETIYREYRDLAQQLSQQGKFVSGDQLRPSETATVVRVRNGKTATTDGPFAETKEQLGSYFLIHAASLDEAVAIAAKIPSARMGSVEVREVIPLAIFLRSMTMTDLPRWLSSYAVEMPAMPDPTTTTSHVASPSSAPAAGKTSTSIQSDLLRIACSERGRTRNARPGSPARRG